MGLYTPERAAGGPWQARKGKQRGAQGHDSLGAQKYARVGVIQVFLLTFIPSLLKKLKFLFDTPRIFKEPLSHQALH